MNADQVIVGWGAAAKFTGRSVASLRRLHAEGRLQTRQDDEGRHEFVQADLQALRVQAEASPDIQGTGSSSTGNGSPSSSVPKGRGIQVTDVELQIYEALARGEALGQISLALGLDPDYVRHRAAAWRRLDGGDSRVQDLAEEVAALHLQVEELEEKFASLTAQIATTVQVLRLLRR